MKLMVLTNNPLVSEKLSAGRTVEYDGSRDYLGILKAARDRIHQGALLLTHPLSGSIKPNETPYKSLLLGTGNSTVDTDSLLRIEEALRMAERMIGQAGTRNWTPKIHEDFQLIDYDLIRHALEHAERHE